MATFADLTAKLNLNIASFAANMQKATAQANKFASQLEGQINTGMVAPAKKSKMEFKDVARIVQGIIISKVFYGGLNAIRSATSAVWEFAQELEYAQMVYTNLFGSTELAEEFINVLKDFAAVTPFAFSDAEAAAKRLLAYGIQYKNVMYVMQGVLAAATVQGSDAAIESISRALGQIYTKGTLKAEEMRQLAEAGIPAYEILREKLGLTAEELGNIGDQAIPAATAINALVDGINERFGDVLEQSSSTTKGLVSNIKDVALMLAAGIFEPVTDKMHDALASIEDLMTGLYEIYQTKGLGGVFEAIIPEEAQAAVRTLIVNLQNLWSVIKSVVASVFSLVKAFIAGLVPALNAIMPVVNAILGVLAAVIKAITTNETLMKVLVATILGAAAAWLIYKVQALAALVTTAVIGAIIKAVKALIIALNFLVAHPVWALLAFGVGVFVALSGASDKFAASIRNLWGSLTSLGGASAEDTLLPETKEVTSDLEKFNEALDTTSDNMDDLADSTGSASKAAAGLLGFDEVFSLKTPDESGSGITDGLDDLLSGLDGLGSGVGDLWGDTDFVGIAQDFVDNILDALGGKEKLLSAGIGALLGAVLGTVIGGPLGAKIGMVAGAIAGYFWPEVANALGLTDVGTIALPIATVLGAAIGFIAGGPLGAVIGAAIGALVGWIADAIARGIEEGDWSSVGLPVGVGLGAAIGMIAGGPLGAAIGATIGALAGWITDMFIDGFSNDNWDASGISLGLGTGIGAAIGMIAGGPVGALIGAAVGALVGWIVGLIIDNWDAIKEWFASVGRWFAKIGKAIGGFFVDIGTAIGNFFKSVWDGITDAWSSITGWFESVGQTIADFFSGLWESFTGFFGDLFASIGEFFSTTWDTISGWFSDLFAPIADAFSNFYSSVLEPVLSDIWSAITTVFSDIVAAVTRVGTDIWTAITTVATTIGYTIYNIFDFIFDLIVKVVTDLWTAVSAWFQKIWDVVVEKVTGIWNSVSEWFQSIWDTVVEKVTGIWNSVTEWFQSIWDAIVEKVTGIWTSVSEWFQAVWDVIVEKLTGALEAVSEWFQSMWDTVVEKVTGIWDAVSEWFQGIWDVIAEKVEGIWNTVSEWFSNIWETATEKVKDIWEDVTGYFSDMYEDVTTAISDMYNSVTEGIGNIYDMFTGWISDMWNNVFGKFFTWINNGIEKLRTFFGLNSEAQSIDTSAYSTSGTGLGHAVGGIFNREHVARFAEGNKAEAIVPLENDTAMQPFVDAVADGLYATLAPLLATFSGSSSSGTQDTRPILYVGNLIADDASLRELNKKMQVINLQESARRGN